MIQQNVLMQGSKNARAGNIRQAQAIMKNYQRRTKNITSEGMQMNRADFNLQCQEVYSNMNQQVSSMKCASVSMQGPPMQQMMYAQQQ